MSIETIGRPAETIRHYLDEHDGHSDARVEHLLTSWHLDAWTAREKDDVTHDLEAAGVQTEPALADLERSDSVTVYVADSHPETPDSAATQVQRQPLIQAFPPPPPPPPPASLAPYGAQPSGRPAAQHKGWWISGLVVLLLCVIGGVVALLVISQLGSKSGGHKAAPAAAHSGAAGSSGTAPVPDVPAQLGDVLTLKGQETTLKVRVSRVIDPLPGGEFDTPSAGKRFVGVQMTLRNVGSAAYNDSVSNGSTLILRGNEQADTTILSGGVCDSSFASDVKIAPGDTRSGCIPLEVPANSGLRTFQFTPDSGFAGDTGEWRIPSTGPTSAVGGGSGSSGAPSYTACDSSISVKAGTTTCPFGENVFYEYWTNGEASSLSVYSPATGNTYATHCSSDGGQIVCQTEDNGEVRFSQASVDAYSQSQADHYAVSHQVGP